MQNENTRNTVIFVVSALLILVVYQFLVLGPQQTRREAQMAVQARQQAAAQAEAIKPGAPAVASVRPVAEALASSPRVMIDTPRLKGSLALTGARLDHLSLNNYRTTTSKTSPPVEMLRPAGSQFAWFAEFGWVGQNLPGLPSGSTPWTLTKGKVLTPSSPIELTYVAPGGLSFVRTISIDDRYMMTLVDKVTNPTAAPVALAPYGTVQRHGIPATVGKDSVVHEGAIAVSVGEKPVYHQLKYPKWTKTEDAQTFQTRGGWTGITDKYWLTALVPQPEQEGVIGFRTNELNGVKLYQADYTGKVLTLAAGASLTETQRLFVGAKEVPALRSYEDKLGIPNFDKAVDWGMFWFLTRPAFWLLEKFYSLVGNFGLAILMLTVVVRLAMFPLANKSYESMSKLKKLQPKMEELKTRYKDDPAKQQQELIAIYSQEKINPMMGCLPLLLQIPVFFSIYKVLSVTLEMRHAPFYGWVHDLAARDPTTLWNLFGLMPFDPAAVPLLGSLLNGPLHLGIWPILYGFTMWLTTAMNPPAPDPIQQRIFQLMPLIFTFIMAPFAAGLLIYWTWSNVLSIIQQYIIMRRYQVDNPIDDFLKRFGARPQVAT